MSHLSNFGVALIGVGEPKKARRILIDALANDPRSSIILSNLALAAKQLGNMEESIAYSRELLKVEPNNGEAYYNAKISDPRRWDAPRMLRFGLNFEL